MENPTLPINETLAPLETKIKQYLDLECNIRLLDVELLSLQSIKTDFDPEREDLEQEIQDGQPTEDLNDKEQKLASMLEQFENLKKELIQYIPEKNKYLEVNFGYGPSKIGYFTTDPETKEVLQEPVLRVVQ